MNILSDEQQRVMTFIAACNRSSYAPTAREVTLWLNHPEPAEAEYRFVERPGIGSVAGPHALGDSLASLYGPAGSISRMIETMYSKQIRPLSETISSMWGQLYGPTTVRELVKPAETVIEHLVRLTWLTEATDNGQQPGLRLTELGRALLRDCERDAINQDVSVVVLEGQDPLAYPLLVGQLANAGAGLLVDPYLKLEGLNRVVISTQLTRLLVSGKKNGGVLSAMETHLASPSLGRRVEVRKSTKLHDRILLAEDGSVFTLGTSLNGVGNTTTVLTPMPSPAREALREEYERLWMEAELVGPQPIEDQQDDGDGADADSEPTDASDAGNGNPAVEQRSDDEGQNDNPDGATGDGDGQQDPGEQ